jgi:nucleotide-binding universal stress UspA family protein
VNVLVATDGQLDPELVGSFAKPLTSGGGSVTVLTVIEIPRRLLAELRSHYGAMEGTVVDRDAEYVSGSMAIDTAPTGWPGDDAVLERYLHDKRVEYTGPLVTHLEAMGVPVTGEVIEGESAAATILARLEEGNHDLVLVGSHGRGFFDGLLGSTGTRLTRHAPCPVLVLRGE